VTCPKCAFELADGAAECPRCGVIFSRLRTAPAVHGAAVALPRRFADAAGREDGRDLRRVGARLAAAFGVALVLYALPLVRFVLSPLAVLFHEFGHTVASWLLGHPAVPAFSFVYGGGFTHQQNFQLPLALLVAGGWIWLGWMFRGDARRLVLVGAGAAFWLFVVSSAWRREALVASTGHLGELVLAGVLLHMALANRGWKAPEIERPLGAAVSFFVAIHSFHFGWKLRNDQGFLADYLQGIGGALMNDLESLSLDLYNFTGVKLSVPDLAGWLMLFSVLAPTIAIGLFALRRRASVA
jgi:hypothetical protein